MGSVALSVLITMHHEEITLTTIARLQILFIKKQAFHGCRITLLRLIRLLIHSRFTSHLKNGSQ